MSFLAVSLPRSRSAWLAHYLSYPLARPPQPVGHEILGQCETVDQFLDSYRNGMWGTCETAGAPLIPIVQREMPECKIVLIRRPLAEVYESLAKAGVVGNLSSLAESNAMLDAAEGSPGVVSIRFEILSHPVIGKTLFEHCLELEFDFEWWATMVQVNVQADVPAWIHHIEENKEKYKKLLEDVERRKCQLN